MVAKGEQVIPYEYTENEEGKKVLPEKMVGKLQQIVTHTGEDGLTMGFSLIIDTGFIIDFPPVAMPWFDNSSLGNTIRVEPYQAMIEREQKQLPEQRRITLIGAEGQELARLIVDTDSIILN